MYGDDCCRIKKMANGFTVEVRDPEIVKANKKRDAIPYDSKTPRTPYRDPNREFVFKDEAAVLQFLKGNLSKLTADAGDDYSSCFDDAVAECNDDDGEDD